MEREVPVPRVGTQPVEDRRSRQRRVCHHQVRDVVTVSLRVCVGDRQPDVVADHYHGIFGAQMRGHQLVDVFGHGPLVIPGGRARGVPGTPLVRRDYPEATLRERRDDQAPFPPGLREAMQEDHCARPLPRGHEVQAQARLDVGHPVIGRFRIQAAHSPASNRLAISSRSRSRRSRSLAVSPPPDAYLTSEALPQSPAPNNPRV